MSASGSASGRGSQVRSCLERILAGVGLEAPDGRPLYDYRVRDEDYERARELLRTRAYLYDDSHAASCALLVVYGAEWFRREADDTMREWARLDILPRDLTPAERSAVVRRGLDWWRVKLERRGGANQYLLTTALHGGFPSRVLLDGVRSWVTRYFRAIMADALAHPQPEAVRLAVRRHEHLLRETFRYEIIFELAEALVGQLVHLRSQLPPDLEPREAVSHLEANRPMWRDELPLHLPVPGPGEEDASARLFGDLLTTDAVALDRSVNVRRLLRLSDKSWVNGVSIGAEGELDSRLLRSDVAAGRFEARLTGAVGALSPRPFAHLHLGGGANGRTLRSQPLERRPLRLWDVAPTEPVRVSLSRSDLAPIAVEWPGGRAIREGVSVWKAIAREDEYELAGLGSTGSAAKTLLVMAPADATVEAQDGTLIEPLRRHGSSALWKIDRRAIVTGAKGERYRIVPGANAEGDERLDIAESYLPHLEAADASLALCHAPLTLKVMSNGLARSARAGELRFLCGGRVVDWRAHRSGRLSVAWRDADGFIVDRRRLLVLPATAAIQADFLPDGGAQVRWQGWRGWRVAIEDGPEGGADGSATLPPRRRADCLVRLTDPQERTSKLRLTITGDSPRLVDRDGTFVRPNQSIDLAAMRNLTLVCTRPEQVSFRLVGKAGITATRRVEGAVPFQTFHELVALLMGLADWRGPRVRVSLSGGEALCSIQRPQGQLALVGRSVTAEGGIVMTPSALAVARPLLRPEREHLLEPDGGGWRVPDRVKGPTLVYLREGETVLTRPTVGVVGSVDEGGLSALEACVLAPDTQRPAAVDRALRALAAATGNFRELRRLRETAIGLRGLSPRAIDWIAALPRHPALLGRLLLSAEPDEVPALLALERDMPFLWMALPLAEWRRAVIATHEATLAALTDAFGEDARVHASRHLAGRMERLVGQADWFAAIHRFVGFTSPLPRTLHDIAQEHVRLRAEDPSRPPSLAGAIARAGVRLPGALGRLNTEHNTTLLAPVALAAAAAGKVELTRAETWAARSALDADGDYVRAAFPHCLEFIR